VIYTEIGFVPEIIFVGLITLGCLIGYREMRCIVHPDTLAGLN